MLEFSDLKYAMTVRAVGALDSELDQIQKWCEENFDSFETIEHGHSIIFIFENEQDMATFKLRWVEYGNN